MVRESIAQENKKATQEEVSFKISAIGEEILNFTQEYYYPEAGPYNQERYKKIIVDLRTIISDIDNHSDFSYTPEALSTLRSFHTIGRLEGFSKTHHDDHLMNAYDDLCRKLYRRVFIDPDFSKTDESFFNYTTAIQHGASLFKEDKEYFSSIVEKFYEHNKQKLEETDGTRRNIFMSSGYPKFLFLQIDYNRDEVVKNKCIMETVDFLSKYESLGTIDHIFQIELEEYLVNNIIYTQEETGKLRYDSNAANSFFNVFCEKYSLPTSIDFSWMKSCYKDKGSASEFNPESAKKRIVYRIVENMKTVSRLEKQEPGIAETMYKDFNIEDFARYQDGMLLTQYRERDNVNAKYGLVIVAKQDHNGAFYNLGSYLGESFGVMKPEYHFRIIEAEDKYSLGRGLVKIKQKYCATEKASFVIIGGHGNKESLDLGKNSIHREDFEGNKLKSKKADFGLVGMFKEGAQVILLSCETGVDSDEGFARTISKHYGNPTQAPEEIARLEGSLKASLIGDKLELVSSMKGVDNNKNVVANYIGGTKQTFENIVEVGLNSLQDEANNIQGK